MLNRIVKRHGEMNMLNKECNAMMKNCLLVLLSMCLLGGVSQALAVAEAEQQNPLNANSDKGITESDMAKDTLSGLVPLPIQLPHKMFVGTPQDMRVPNLEKPLGKPRPPFYAPTETKNVAAGKPVTSTENEPLIGELTMITDGDKEAMDGSYIELGRFLQSVTIDLEAEYEIYAILVWHYHKQPRIYFDVIVQIADDPDFEHNVRTLFNNDIDNSAGLGMGHDMHYVETNEGKLIDAKGQRARYVRLYSNGNNVNELNSYIEVQVFGNPAK